MTKEKIEKIEKRKCGIIMPIASHSEYPKEHWKEVLNILIEAISKTEFEPRLVSDDVAIGLIHERIVNNIYNDDIVVCDVSSKNPNVMFELGMRLAFDKPTIIIKDENTGYSFDTGVIEHLNYPSSLRFNKIVDFKNELIKRINATWEKSQSEKNYSPFLKSFGKTIIPAKINQTEIPESKFILSRLERLTDEVQLLRLNNNQLNDNNNLSGLSRRRFVREKINEFLSINPHLDKEFVLVNLVDMLKDDVQKYYTFKPTTQEIVIAIENYYKDQEELPINKTNVEK